VKSLQIFTANSFVTCRWYLQTAVFTIVGYVCYLTVVYCVGSIHVILCFVGLLQMKMTFDIFGYNLIFLAVQYLTILYNMQFIHFDTHCVKARRQLHFPFTFQYCTSFS